MQRLIHGMAKLTIGHLHCALPTNKPKSFIRRNQRFFRTYIISHICLYIAYNPLQKYNLSLKPANILRFFYHYHDKGLIRVICRRLYGCCAQNLSKSYSKSFCW